MEISLQSTDAQVTVIVCTHDRPMLMRRALASILAQTYTHYQVIVIADTNAYLAPHQEINDFKGRCHYLIRGGEPGPARSRNMGLALVQTRYVMFLDDDDTLAPNHLEELMRSVQAHAQALTQSVPIWFCDFQVSYEDRSTEPPTTESVQTLSIQDTTAASVFVRNTIPNSCLLYDYDSIKGIRFDEHLQIYEDWAYLLECLSQLMRQRAALILQHIPVHGVIIHKTRNADALNARRGNAKNDLVLPVTLELYQRFRAPTTEVRQARRQFFEGAGLKLGDEYF